MSDTRMNASVSVRMPKRDVVLLLKVSKARGEDISDFVRRAVRTELARLSYLDEDERKALGIRLHPGTSNVVDTKRARGGGR